MAQKDIQELAKYMESLEQDDINYKKACAEAAKEAEEAIAEDIDNSLEDDEVIDKTVLGFVDDADTSEADEFYFENDDYAFEEDISDCIKNDIEPISESTTNGSIQIEVFNDDGFGEHFVSKLMQAVPSVKANRLKKPAANGDIIVKIQGDIDSLRKAFAFWTGNREFNNLSNDDKELFDSLLVYADGDTIAEADYREAVAHCLDPIGVNASTANLNDYNSCQLSMVQEEKIRRSANKMLKALKEKDFSDLSDDDLEKLDKIQTAMKHGDGFQNLSVSDVKTLEALAKSMGYSLKEWMALSPEQQDKLFKNIDDIYTPSKSGFSAIHTRKKDNGKIEKYRNQYNVYDPDSQSMQHIMFNPNYTADDSPYQHPKADARRAADEMKKAEQDKLRKQASDAMKNARGKDTWTLDEFRQMIQHLSGAERKELMNSLIDDATDSIPNSQEAGQVVQFIKDMFGAKQTVRDFGKSWGVSHVAVSKFIDRLQGDIYVVARKVTGLDSGGKALKKITMSNDKNLKTKFKEELEKYLNAQPRAKRNPVDPEREARKIASRNKGN